MLRTLHGKLLLTYLAITVLGLGILGVYLLRALNEAFLDQVKLGLADEAKLIAQHWGMHPLPLEPGRELDREATRVAEQIGVTVVVTDRHCQVLAHSGGLREGVELRPEVPDALRGRVGVCVRSGPKIIGRQMHIAYPIRNNGRITGVVRLAVPLSRIDSQLAAVRRAIA
jgi:two-component system phosphate regulon sensor histidine kinase PhoR